MYIQNQNYKQDNLLKANSHDMFSIYVFGAYVENISSEIEICTVFLTTCGKHTK